MITMNERTFLISPPFFSVKDNSLFNKTQNENIMPVILSEAKDQAHPPPDVYDLPSVTHNTMKNNKKSIPGGVKNGTPLITI